MAEKSIRSIPASGGVNSFQRNPKISSEETTTNNNIPDISIKEKLLSEGYTQTTDNEGNTILRSPSQTYMTAWDKDPGYRKYGSYSQREVTLDSSGRIIRETTYSPKLQEASSGWAFYEAVPVEVKTYDYEEGTLTTETPDTDKRTFLHEASLEPKGSAVVKEQVVEPRYKEDVVSSTKLDFGGTPITSRTLAYSTYPKVYEEVKVHQEEKYQSYLSQFTSEGQILIQSLKPEQKLAMVNYEEVNKINKIPMKQFYESFKQGESTITEKPDGSIELNVVTVTPSSKSYFGITQGIIERAKMAKEVAPNILLKVDVVIAGTIIAAASSVIEPVAFALFAPKSKMKELDFDYTDIPENMIKKSEFQQAQLSLGMTGSFMPSFSTGFTNPSITKRFKPERAEGETFFKSSELDINLKTATIKVETEAFSSEPKFLLKRPEVLEYEFKSITQPEPVVTRLVGEKSSIAALPDGTQYVTVEGKSDVFGNNYYMRQKIIGEEVTTKYFKNDNLLFTTTEEQPAFSLFEQKRIGSSYDGLNFRGKEFEVSKKADIDILSGKPVDVAKYDDFLERGRTDVYLQEGRGESTVGGLTPKVEVLTGVKESVVVESLKPRVDVDVLKIGDKYYGEMSVGGTEYEIVNYPVETEPAQLIKRGSKFEFSKPPVFKTVQDVGMKQPVFLSYEKEPTLFSAEILANGKYGDISWLEPLKPKPNDAFKAASFSKGGKTSISSAYDLKLSLEQYDPFGLSGDRIRSMFDDGINIVEVEPVSKVVTKVFVNEPIVPNGSPFRPPVYAEEISPLISQRIIPLDVINVPTVYRTENRMDSMTKNIVNVSPKVIIRNEVKSLTESEMVSRLENKNLLNTRNVIDNRMILDVKNLLDVKTLNETITKNELLTRSLTETKTETVTETVSKLRINTLTKTPSVIPQDIQSINTPTNNSIIPKFDFDYRRNAPIDAFDVFVRESSPKGENEVEEVKVNKSPLPKNRALNLGDDYVDNTSARTFRLVPAGTTSEVDDVGFLDAYKYRRKQSTNPKIKIESFIENDAFLIDSPGEMQEITVKGWKAQRNKGMRGGLL